MKIIEIESKGLKKSFKITVEAARINEAMEAELKVAGEQVKIPGFRPGFIPMKVLKSRYGKSVEPDVLKQVITRTTNEALAEKKLKPAMTPKIDLENYKAGEDLTYTVAFETLPPVPDVAYDKIKIERPVFSIEEKDIDAAITRIGERNPQHVRAKVGTKAKLGQVVVIDFKGTIDGIAFDGGTAKDFKLELGSKRFIEGFEDQLVGAKEGDERDVKVTFPADYAAKELAGKAANFAVTVKEIQDRQPPEWNDEFAKAFGFADLRAFREAVRNQMMNEYNQAVRRLQKKELFDLLEEEYDFDLPQSMVDLEFNAIWERLMQAKKEGDGDLADKSDDELKDEYQKIAQRRVKLGILLAEIGTRNNLTVAREELAQAAMQQAQQFPGQERQIMAFYREHPEQIETLRGPILEEKAVDFILGKIKFNDKPMTLAELAGEGEGGESKSAQKKSKPKSKPKKKRAEG